MRSYYGLFLREEKQKQSHLVVSAAGWFFCGLLGFYCLVFDFPPKVIGSHRRLSEPAFGHIQFVRAIFPNELHRNVHIRGALQVYFLLGNIGQGMSESFVQINNRAPTARFYCLVFDPKARKHGSETCTVFLCSHDQGRQGT